MNAESSSRWVRHSAIGRWRGLDFTLELPGHWTFELPAIEPIDFEHDHSRLQALLLASDAQADVQLLVAARPAVTVSPLVVSAVYFMGQQGLLMDVDGDDRPVGPHAAISGPARLQQQGRMRSAWYAYFEDGGRLVHLCLQGPIASAPMLAQIWAQLLPGFRLLRPQGAQGSKTEWPRSAPIASGPAPWWLAAQALQQGGRLDDALALVERECDHQGAVLAQAELCARQMRALIDAGDLQAARAAHQQSADLAWAYAAQATSGGEGAALSLERDRFLAQLGPAPAIER